MYKCEYSQSACIPSKGDFKLANYFASQTLGQTLSFSLRPSSGSSWSLKDMLCWCSWFLWSRRLVLLA